MVKEKLLGHNFQEGADLNYPKMQIFHRTSFLITQQTSVEIEN